MPYMQNKTVFTALHLLLTLNKSFANLIFTVNRATPKH